MPHPALIDDIFEEILAKLRNGDTITKAMRGTGLSVSHLSSRMERHPEMRARFDAARQEGGQTLQDSLRDKAKEIAFNDEHPKQWNALDRALEAYVPEFQRKTVVEHQGPTVWIGMSEVVDAEYEELDSGTAAQIAPGTDDD